MGLKELCLLTKSLDREEVHAYLIANKNTYSELSECLSLGVNQELLITAAAKAFGKSLAEIEISLLEASVSGRLTYSPLKKYSASELEESLSLRNLLNDLSIDKSSKVEDIQLKNSKLSLILKTLYSGRVKINLSQDVLDISFKRNFNLKFKLLVESDGFLLVKEEDKEQKVNESRQFEDSVNNLVDSIVMSFKRGVTHDAAKMIIGGALAMSLVGCQTPAAKSIAAENNRNGTQKNKYMEQILLDQKEIKQADTLIFQSVKEAWNEVNKQNEKAKLSLESGNAQFSGGNMVLHYVGLDFSTNDGRKCKFKYEIVNVPGLKNMPKTSFRLIENTMGSGCYEAAVAGSKNINKRLTSGKQ